MSSFHYHEDNIMALKDLGFDVSEYLDSNGKVEYESWNHDALVDLVEDIILSLTQDDYTFKEKHNAR